MQHVRHCSERGPKRCAGRQAPAKSKHPPPPSPRDTTHAPNPGPAAKAQGNPTPPPPRSPERTTSRFSVQQDDASQTLDRVFTNVWAGEKRNFSSQRTSKRVVQAVSE